MAYFSRLLNRSLIRLTGQEARPFLQGLVSTDVLQIMPERAAYGLLLTPQGRFLHEMFIFQDESDLLIDTASENVELLLKRLKIFKLKRDVDFTLLNDWTVACYWSSQNDSLMLRSKHIFADPRLQALGYRLYFQNENTLQAYDLGAEHAEAETYEAHRISLGIPDGSNLIPEKSFPLDFDMDDLCAINYRKGCYIGQEVTARMHFKTQPRKGVYKVMSQTGFNLPEIGTEVFADDKAAGIVVSVSGSEGIAILKHDMVMQSSLGIIHAAGVELISKRPDWAKQILNEFAEGNF